MDEYENPEQAVEAGKAHLKAAADDFKEAATAKVEDIRQSAVQTADEFRSAAQHKARELQETAQSAYSDVSLKARTWQVEAEAFIHKYPGKSILIAVCSGFVFGLISRK